MNWPTEVLILNEKCTTHHLYFKSHKVKTRQRLETWCWSNLWHWSRLIHFIFLSFLFSLSPQKQDVQHQYGNAGGKCSRGKWGIPLLLKEEFNSLAVDDVTHHKDHNPGDRLPTGAPPEKKIWKGLPSWF